MTLKWFLRLFCQVRDINSQSRENALARKQEQRITVRTSQTKVVQWKGWFSVDCYLTLYPSVLWVSHLIRIQMMLWIIWDGHLKIEGEIRPLTVKVKTKLLYSKGLSIFFYWVYLSSGLDCSCLILLIYFSSIRRLKLCNFSRF